MMGSEFVGLRSQSGSSATFAAGVEGAEDTSKATVLGVSREQVWKYQSEDADVAFESGRRIRDLFVASFR